LGGPVNSSQSQTGSWAEESVGSWEVTEPSASLNGVYGAPETVTSLDLLTQGPSLVSRCTSMFPGLSNEDANSVAMTISQILQAVQSGKLAHQQGVKLVDELKKVIQQATGSQTGSGSYEEETVPGSMPGPGSWEEVTVPGSGS